MRIISGKYGKRRFDVPSSFSARPTTDFAKENIFNVLGNLIDLEGLLALDLFAGTGSISFELLSRGCQRVVAVEKEYKHAAFIEKVADLLNVTNLTLIRGDVFRYLRGLKEESFNLIFADPPYALQNLAEIPQIILEANVLKKGGILIMEHPREYDFSDLPHFSRHKVYGSVNFSLFIREEERKDA